MTSFDFETTTHGKWLLAGEHAVLRGCPVIIFPLLDKTLSLRYQKNSQKISVAFSGDFGEDSETAFLQLLTHALSLIKRNPSEVHGKFMLDNQIPVGCGLGASAALCVALTRWLIWQNWLPQKSLYTFAHQLEHVFHGESSGADVAGALTEQGIVFYQDGSHTPLTQQWQPNWRLTFCGETTITAHCVNQVKAFVIEHPGQGKKIDNEMRTSVQRAIDALAKPKAQGLPELANAINQAANCFKQWGLVSVAAEQHMDELLTQGALAAKPTGSGGGGFILSLWK